MTIKALYPANRPVIDFNFALTKRLDPRISLTRSSTATYVDASGQIRTAAINEPRFEHSPVTGESLGLFLEGQRANLITQSDDWTTEWSLTNLTVDSETMAGPSGTRAYTKLVLGAFTASRAAARSNVGIGDGSSLYANSFYVKQGTIRYVGIQMQRSNSNSIFKYFDTQLGIFYSVTNVSTTDCYALDAGNGWWRICARVTDAGPGGSASMHIVPMTVATPPSIGTGYDAVGGEYVYVHAAQREIAVGGGHASSYIPTAGAAVTRSADVAAVIGANSGFSSFFNPKQGTLLAESSFPYPAAFTRSISSIAGFAASDNNPVIAVYGNNVNLDGVVRGTGGGATSQPIIARANLIANALNKAALAYSVNASDLGIAEAFAYNGTVLGPQSPTGNTMSGINNLKLGRNVHSGDVLGPGVTLRRVAYWNSQLPQSIVQALSRV
jgi:hypothetical protein